MHHGPSSLLKFTRSFTSVPSLADLPPVLPEVQHHLLIPSDKAKSGYKGVNSNHGRYMAQCNTSPCHHGHLGMFGTSEEAAQVYLQHWEKEHPEELAKERVPRSVLLPVQEHLLIRSDRSSTGFTGVYPNKGRYQAKCDTSPCHNNHLGSFGTPEEAAQAYLQHHQHSHSHQPPNAPDCLQYAPSTGHGKKRKHVGAAGDIYLPSFAQAALSTTANMPPTRSRSTVS
jgi:hypothetical protein